jgi:hypothetical protein
MWVATRNLPGPQALVVREVDFTTGCSSTSHGQHEEQRVLARVLVRRRLHGKWVTEDGVITDIHPTSTRAIML